MSFDNHTFDYMLRDTVDYLYRWERDARLDFEFYALRQWSAEDKAHMEESMRPALTFDRTRPIIDAASGSEVINRHEASFKGREANLRSGDPQKSEGASRLYRYTLDRASAVHHISLAYHSTLTCGVGCTNQEMKYDMDPDGIIATTRIPIFEMGWDPISIEPNMADARWVIRDRWVEYDELASFFGKKNVDDVISEASSQSSSSQGFWAKLFMREERQTRIAYDANRYGHFYDERTRRLRLWECQRYERRYMNRAFIPAMPGSGEFEESQDINIEKENFGDFKEQIDAQILSYNLNFAQPQGLEPVEPMAYVEDFPVRTYYRSWHAGSKVLKEEEIPTRAYSYQFITAYEDWSRTGERYFFGVMKPMRDPQQYANKFFSHMVHMWSSNPKGAVIAEDSFFENKEEAQANWAQTDGFLTVKDGALQTPKPRFQVIDSKISYRGIETLLQHALGSVSQAAGINSEYFVGGADDLRRTAGSAIESIKQSNLSVLAGPFDSLRLYRETHARNTMSFVAQYMSPENVAKIIGEEADPQILEAMVDKSLQDLYDIVVTDSPQTETEQKEVFDKIIESQFLPQLMQMGVSIPASMAKFIPMPSEITQDFETVFESAQEVQGLQAELTKVTTQIQIIEATMQLQMMQAQMQMANQTQQQGGPPMGPDGSVPVGPGGVPVAGPNAGMPPGMEPGMEQGGPPMEGGAEEAPAEGQEMM